MNIVKYFRNYPILFSAAVAAIIIILCGIVILSSMLAMPTQIYRLIPDTHNTLADDQNIDGWIEFDKSSFHIGEVINQKIRILYRDDKVVPDIDSLRRRMSFFPLEQRALNESTRIDADGITEYVLEFELQAVRVEPQQTYNIEPFILYYTTTEQTNENIYSQVIQPPPIHIAAYYPLYLQSVVLQPLKGALDNAESLRKPFMAFSATLLLALAILVLWHFGRRRPVSELTEEEHLWRTFKSIDPSLQDNRTTVLNYEHVFTHLLHIQTGITPEAFWSGDNPEDDDWRELAAQIRELLLENYQPAIPEDDAVEKMKLMLSERLSKLVSESRLLIEQQPSFRSRISQQPLVITQSAILAVLALILISMNAVPDLWLSPELREYNSVINALEDEETEKQQTYLKLSAMGDQASNNNIKYAALYNAGTIRADNSFSMYTRELEEMFLNAVIMSNTVETLFHVLLEEGPFDEESQIVSVLVDGAEQLRRAHLDLQAAVRVYTYDEDVQRNMEIVIKRRELVLERLGQIRQFYRSQEEGEDEALADEGIINLLEAELPEDDEEESSGKDDKGYMILERF